ncbi:MAG: hypothetical protein ACR2JR_06465 [Rubrobacteraceae bacterium]
MRAVEKLERTANLVICVSNDGYELDLELWQVYEMVPDNNLEPDDLRVIDETGEDYIYPASYFVTIENLERDRFVN